MAYRGREAREGTGGYQYRCIEVVLVDRASGAEKRGSTDVLVVDNQWDTLRYVQENIEQFVGNAVRAKELEKLRRSEVEETARLFRQNLGPLFVLFSALAKEHVLDKLSGSLRKALLLMAMERYNCDRESICRALGLTRMKLDRELSRCGLLPHDGETL